MVVSPFHGKNGMHSKWTKQLQPRVTGTGHKGQTEAWKGAEMETFNKRLNFDVLAPVWLLPVGACPCKAEKKLKRFEGILSARALCVSESWEHQL